MLKKSKTENIGVKVRIVRLNNMVHNITPGITEPVTFSMYTAIKLTSMKMGTMRMRIIAKKKDPIAIHATNMNAKNQE